MTEREANAYLNALANKYRKVTNDAAFNFAAKISHPTKENESAILFGIKELSLSNITRIKSSFSEELKNLETTFDKDIFVEHSDDIEFLCCLDDSEKSIKKQEELEGGISISSAEALGVAGTLGGIFQTKNSNNFYLITNAHVLKFGSIEIDKNTVVHPAVRDESENKRLNIGEIIWKSDYSNNIDAAIVKLHPLDDKIKIGNTTRCNEVFFENISNPIDGIEVKKCGRRTGFLSGKIISNNCLIITKEKLQFENQIMTTLIADSG